MARRYELRYVAPQRVLDPLEAVLASVKGEVKVDVDPRSGALQVVGGEESQRLAAQLVATLDRPANARPDLPPDGAPVVEAFPLDAASAGPMMQRLTAQFQGRTGVTLAHNPRSGQLLAMAPPAVQLQIWQAFQSARIPQGGQRPATPDPILSDSISLRRIDVDELVAGLSNIWGRKL
ncbi:MAG: hypothetical protein KDA41_13335, partial [Planctomycetales bacterium]|nr:hypothetical protein [Planctomycetales bacterium]